jgi:hypothetical protein
MPMLQIPYIQRPLGDTQSQLDILHKDILIIQGFLSDLMSTFATLSGEAIDADHGNGGGALQSINVPALIRVLSEGLDIGTAAKVNFIDGINVNFTVSYDAINNRINITATGYTDEQAQDAVGNNVGNGLDYDDITGAISIDEVELNHNALNNLTLADPHTQYQLESEKDTDNGYSGHNEGTFTVTATGFTASITGTARWVKNGKAITLFIPTLTGTSNATTMTLTGLPASIQPTQTFFEEKRMTDNGIDVTGVMRFNNASGTVDLFSSVALGVWTALGTKTFYAAYVTYHIG